MRCYTDSNMHAHYNHFKKVDARLASLIKNISLPQLKTPKNYFRFLVEAIISQQLSLKAADSITTRFKKIFFGKSFPTAAEILKTSEEKMRGAGLSRAKITYIKDLSAKIMGKEISLRRLKSLDDEDIIEYLTRVKGIGRWTAEMFLIFALGREDVFSYGDLGLHNALKKLYTWKREPNRRHLEKLVNAWSPYKSYAARYLWKSLDNE